MLGTDLGHCNSLSTQAQSPIDLYNLVENATSAQGLTTSEVSSLPNLDAPFLEYIWCWLIRNPEILVGEHGQYKHLTLAEAEASHQVQKETVRAGEVCEPLPQEASLNGQEGVPVIDTRNITDVPSEDGKQSTLYSEKRNATSTAAVPIGIRLFTTESRMWYALTGHAPDPSRVRSLDFIILSTIAACGPKGILQHDLVRVSGQDKRSLPHRTDRLYEDGYIEKTRVVVVQQDRIGTQRMHTSLCILKRFAKDAEYGIEVARLMREANVKKTRRKGRKWRDRKSPPAQPSGESVAEERSQEIDNTMNNRGPQWIADRSVNKQIFDLVDRSGTIGLTLSEVRDQLFGEQYRKPAEYYMGRLVDAWQISQPLHLRHLAILRDTVLRGKSPVYIHYTYGNFNKLVQNGKASWEAVTTVSSSVRKGEDVAAALDAQVQLDGYGFPLLNTNEFNATQYNATQYNASLAECAMIMNARPANRGVESRHLQKESNGPFAMKSATKGHVSTLCSNAWKAGSAQPDPLVVAVASEERVNQTVGFTGTPLDMLSVKRSTIVKKGLGRPRKYLRAGVPSDLESMPFEEVKYLHRSRQMAEKYQKTKIIAEIDRRVALGETAIAVTHSVLQETDDLVLEKDQDPLFPHVRAQILHEYANGPIPELTELEKALARFAATNSPGSKKKGTRKKVFCQAPYWPSVAAHTLRVLDSSETVFVGRKPRDSRADPEVLKSRTRHPRAALPKDVAPKSKKAPKKINGHPQYGDSPLQYVPSICAHSGSFLPLVLKVGKSKKPKQSKVKYASTTSDQPLPHIEYVLPAKENSSATGPFSTETSLYSSGQTLVPPNEPTVPELMTKRYQEQLKSIKRPCNGAFTGKSSVLKRRSGEPKHVPAIHYKLLIFKLEQLRSLDWTIKERVFHNYDPISQPRDRCPVSEEISRQTECTNISTSGLEGRTEIRTSQPSSRIESSQNAMHSNADENTHSKAEQASQLDLGSRTSPDGAQDLLPSDVLLPQTDGNPNMPFLPVKKVRNSEKRKRRSVSPPALNDSISKATSVIQSKKQKQSAPVLGLFQTPKGLRQPLQIQPAPKTPAIPCLEAPHTFPSTVMAAVTSDLAGAESDLVGGNEADLHLPGEQGVVASIETIEKEPVTFNHVTDSRSRVNVESCESRNQTPHANRATARPQAQTQIAEANKAAETGLDPAKERTNREEVVPCENSERLDLVDETRLEPPPQPDTSTTSTHVDASAIVAADQADDEDAKLREANNQTPPLPRRRKDPRHGKIAVGRISRTGGSTAILRKEIVMDLVKKCGGASPGFRELAIPFGVEWSKRGQEGIPETDTVRTAVNALCASGKLRQITFAYQTKQGLNKTTSMLTLSEISPGDPRVQEVQDEMIRLGSNKLYLPKAWLMGDVTQGSEPISVPTAKPTSQLRKTDAHQRLQTHKLSLQKSEKSKQDRLAALRAIQERNKQRTNRASKQNITSLADLTATRKPPVKRLATIRRPAYAGPAQLRRVSSHTVPIVPPSHFHRASPQRLPSRSMLEAQAGCGRDVMFFAGDVLPRSAEAHDAAQPSDMQSSTEQSKSSMVDTNLIAGSQELPYEDDLPPRSEWDPYRDHNVPPSSRSTSCEVSRSSSPDTTSAMSSILPIPLPLVPGKKTKTYNRRGDHMLPVIPGFMAPQQSFHIPSGTFGTSFLGWLRTFGSIASIMEGVTGAQMTRVSKMQPPLLRPRLTKRKWPRKTYLPITKTRFEVEVDQSEKWELTVPDLEHVMFPRWTFINHTLQHPHKRVTQVIASVGVGRLCSFTGSNGRLLSKPIRPSTKSGWSCLPHLMKSSAKVTPRNHFDSKYNSVGNMPARPALKRRRAQSVSEDEDGTGFEELGQPHTGVRHAKRFRLKGPRNARVLGEEVENHLITAVVVVRCLTGGLEKRIDWSLVKKTFEPDQDADLMHSKWNHVQQKYKLGCDRMESDFQELFAKAYEEGILPAIDYRDLEAYPWKWLVQWVTENIDAPIQSVPDLPLDRSYLLDDYVLNGITEDDINQYYELHQPLVPHARETIINKHAWTNPSSGDSPIASGGDNTDVSVAKTWIRANIVADEATYQSDLARATLQTFSDDTIDAALRILLMDKVLTHEKKPRPAPGRNYGIHEYTLNRLQKNILLADFRRAATFKIELDREIALNGTAEYSPHAENGDVMTVLNLVAARRITLATRNVPMNKFGHTDGDYQTRQMDKTRLFCSVEICALPSYVYGNPLLPLPPPPAHHLQTVYGNAKLKIPLWYDIHGYFVPRMWELALSAVMAVLATRPGIDKVEVEKALRPALEAWECEWVLEWIVRSGAGKLVSEFRNKSYMTDEWWYLIFGRDEGPTVDMQGLVNSRVVDKGKGKERVV
ncbi:MAG: hypothetical protein Q9164_000051 [Protoblastenia rupestris]